MDIEKKSFLDFATFNCYFCEPSSHYAHNFMPMYVIKNITRCTLWFPSRFMSYLKTQLFWKCSNYVNLGKKQTLFVLNTLSTTKKVDTVYHPSQFRGVFFEVYSLHHPKLMILNTVIFYDGNYFHCNFCLDHGACVDWWENFT